MKEFENKSFDELELMFIDAYKGNDMKSVVNILTKSELKENITGETLMEAVDFLMKNKSDIALSQYLMTFAMNSLDRLQGKPGVSEELTREHVLSLNQTSFGKLITKEVDNGDVEKVEFLMDKDFAHLRTIALTNNIFFKAVQNGNLDIVKMLLSNPDIKIDINYENRNSFFTACEYGYADIVDYLLTSPDVKEKPDMHKNSDAAFRNACQNGHVEVVKTLLAIPNFAEDGNISNCMSCASQKDQPEVVKFLLQSPEYQRYVHEDSYQPLFVEACYHGNMPFARYLLDSPEIKHHATVDGDDGSPNDFSISNGVIAAIKGKQKETLEFLIFEMNAEKTEIINEFLSKNTHSEVEKMFSIKKASDNLYEELQPKQIEPAKIKKNKL